MAVIAIVDVDGNVIVAVHVNGNDPVIVISPDVDDGSPSARLVSDLVSDQSE